MEKNQKQLLQNPRENANIISIVTFSWLNKIFRLGFTRKLENSDLYSVLRGHSSEVIEDRIFKMCDKQQTKFHNGTAEKNPNLFKVLAHCFRNEFVLNLLVIITGKTILRTIEPFLLVKVLSYFNSKEKMLKSEAYYWTSFLLILKIVISVFIHQFNINQAYLGMKVRVACSSLIYKKILRLSKSSLENETSAGQVVNFLSHDVRIMEQLAGFIYYLLHSPLQIIIFSWVIYWQLGVSPIAGISIVLLMIPAQGYVGKWVGQLMEKCVSSSDKRLSLMSEIINSIQVIKMYTWEKSFSELVIKTRKKEACEIRNMWIVGSIVQTLKIYIPQLCIFITILTSIALDTTISTESVYMLISFYSQIREDFCNCFTHALQILTKSMVSANRIENFLNSEEKKDYSPNSKEKGENDSSIKLTRISAKWFLDSKEETLKDMNLSLKDSKLTAIIGQIGSGKSSLLQVILNELLVLSGEVKVTGKISYASQEPWVFASSVRQNILFGLPMNKERYEKVISVCQLRQDVRTFSFGDQTLIGEKGINLSGGQRARINLARAVYSDADIYMFDDPLSAVDPEVGKRIFQDCMCDFLKDKTRILVTHQLQFLRSVDHIVVLSNGSLQQEGTLNELLQSDLDFVKVLKVKKDVKGEIVNEDLIPTHSSEDGFLVENEEHLDQEEVSELKTIAIYRKGVFWFYLKSVGNVWIIILTLALGFSYQTFLSGNDYFLSRWMNAEEAKSMKIAVNDTFSEDIEKQREWYIKVYGILLALVALSVTAFCFAFFEMCVRAAQGLHQSMFYAVIRAPMLFFHENPSGRILNRFSKDMSTVDKEFPEYMEDIAHVGFQLLAVIIIIMLYNPWSLILSLLMAIACYLVRYIYVRTSHSLKHLEAASRSPIFNHVNATIDGLITIRAQIATELLRNEFNNIQDHNTSAQFLFASAERCLGFYTELIVLMFVLSVAYLLITLNDDIHVGDAGLIILQSFQMSADLQWAMLQTAELENQLTSVERILEYSDLDQEPSFETQSEIKLPKDWPSNGHVKFNNVSLSYHPKRTAVLKNLNLTILPKEKIGIVGRTGAGKTSLIAALFRLAYMKGEIYIDDVETSNLGLHDLRSKISIIPQQPVLFAGTLRRNLYPFKKYSDQELWQALEDVQLKDILKAKGAELDTKISDGGSNFSVGECQLLSLARAILRNNKILVLDEATANVDPQTDKLIQKTIRERFKDCTVFIIAHRLGTVMDCDKFIVMDNGSIVEFEHPYLLLQNEEGYLYKMVQQTGPDMVDVLTKLAEESYKKIRKVETTQV